MKFEVKVPAVGESINEVTIAQWLKKEGESVAKDELVCEIESDKASFEIPAEEAGVLTIKAAEGDIVQVGAVIASIDTDGASTTAPAAPQPASNPVAEPVVSAVATGNTVTLTVPAVGESINEVILASWLKGNGDTVTSADLVCEIESDKASFEIPAEHSGVLKHLVSEGATLEIGAAIAEISVTEGASAGAATATSAAPAAAVSSSPVDDDGQPRISPVAAKILAEAGISPASVTGTGPGNRITKDDARDAVAAAQNGSAPVTVDADNVSVGSVTTTVSADNRGERRERMSSLRKTIARRLVTAKNDTAMLTTFNEVDMSAIRALRGKYKEAFKDRHEIGLGFMSFFTKAVCLALQEWPAVNARIDDDHIVFHDYCDISIAVSSPKGLVVPVVRNAESLSFAGIEKEIKRLALKAREGKLTIEEMTGGTFTITNGGIFGSLASTPIINQPQSAILGMHKIEDRPMVVNGEIVARPMMYVALSYDHRIIDGRESVSFLVRVKELLEDPSRMLIEI